MRILGFLFIVLFSSVTIAQSLDELMSIEDKYYREDQFYIGVSYNILRDKPQALKQNGFSSGVFLGFIRDLPINKDRTIGFGLGVGLATNAYKQNLLFLTETDINIVPDAVTTDDNKFYTHLIEFPIEFRWRTSTSTSTNFWRIYGGVKLGYQFQNATKFEGSIGEKRHVSLDAFERFQYGLHLNAGYNTWNFHIYYGLSSLFKDNKVPSQFKTLKTLNAGLIFYLF